MYFLCIWYMVLHTLHMHVYKSPLIRSDVRMALLNVSAHHRAEKSNYSCASGSIFLSLINRTNNSGGFIVCIPAVPSTIALAALAFVNIHFVQRQGMLEDIILLIILILQFRSLWGMFPWHDYKKNKVLYLYINRIVAWAFLSCLGCNSKDTVKRVGS